LRTVPDHQEVYADNDTDQSFIVEINARVDAQADSAALEYFARDLAKSQDAQEVKLVHGPVALHAAQMPQLHPTAFYRSQCVMEQRVARYKEAARNIVQTFMVLVRMREITSDVLITFNAPVAFTAGSITQNKAVVDASVNRTIAERAVATFRVNSWRIFFPPSEPVPQALEALLGNGSNSTTTSSASSSSSSSSAMDTSST
jgi:hypothetical protein